MKMGVKSYLKEKAQNMWKSAKKRFFKDISEDAEEKAEDIKED